jgi:hypothetical protein
MQWGSGEVTALARIATLTREYLLAIDLTLAMALEWVDFYENVLLDNPSNHSARGRIPLMKRAAELLEDAS